MNKILVVILCQQPLFRSGIEHSLSKISDIELLQCHDFRQEALKTLDTMLPDVIIADIDDTSNDYFNKIQEIKKHLTNVGFIIISSSDDDEQIFQALKSQAAAYLTKGVTTEELVDTIRRVAHGEYPINEIFVHRPKVASQVVDQFQELTQHSEAGDYMSPLTAREKEVLDYIAQGYLNKQIATELGISEQTIKNHVTSVLRKLNANSRTDAVVQAIKQGLISVS